MLDSDRARMLLGTLKPAAEGCGVRDTRKTRLSATGVICMKINTSEFIFTHRKPDDIGCQVAV